MHTPFVVSYGIRSRYPEAINLKDTDAKYCSFCGRRIHKMEGSPWYRCNCHFAQEYLNE